MIIAILIVLVVLFIALPLIGMALWAFATTILVGLIIGALARLILPGRQGISLLATVGCGLIGSIVGGFFGQHVFHSGHIITIILEVLIAAGAVAVFSRGTGDRLSAR